MLSPMIVSAWGWGGNGQLGLGDRESRIKPHAVRALRADAAIAQVVCGSRFTLARTTSGAVLAWGKNDYGQLGTGDTKAQIEPRLVEGLAGTVVTALASKGSHVLALTDDGRVFSWGRGDEGQLGHGDRVSIAAPRQIQAFAGERIVAVAAGRSHSLALTAEGAVYTWGSNDDGALGRRTTGAAPNASHDCQQLSDRREGEEDEEDDATACVPGRIGPEVFLAPVVQIECGSRHNVILTSDKRVFAWGWGIYGQLGTGSAVSRGEPTEIVGLRGKRVRRVHCGFRHSFAVLPRRLTRRVTSSSIEESRGPDDSSSMVDVWGWGWNEYGQLGEVTPTSSVLKPMPISSLCNVDLRLLAAGGRHSICHVGVAASSPVMTGVRARSETDPRIGFRGSFFKTLAWGRGSDGELGLGSVKTTSLPASIPVFEGRPLEQLSCGWAHSASLGMDAPFDEERDGHIESSWADLAISIGDIDAFFGLLVQFIIQILLIFQILPVRCGFTTELVTTRVIPAAAMTVTIGNSFFGFLASALAKKEGRADVTAMPEGINTVLVFAYALSVMAPEYDRTRDPNKAWEAGLFAAFMTGFLQILCLPFVNLMRRCIPRAALLASVAGVALAFLTMAFAFEVWQNPMVALAPLVLVLICLGAGVKLPFHVPTGLGALLLGTCTAFVLIAIGYPTSFVPFSTPYEFEIIVPGVDFRMFINAMTSGEGWKYMSVVVPMVLVNVMSTLANLETAVAVGDNFDPNTAILGDSMSTIIGACLGNPFPTNVYIGQPIYKSMGARVSYVFLTAAAATLMALMNAATLIANTVPLSCGVGFLLWIGLVITASSFNRNPTSNTNHGTAVALGIVPALASWAFQLVQSAITATWSNASTNSTVPLDRILDTLTKAGVNPTGMIALSQGYLLTSIILASTMVNIIEREFLLASAWMAAAAFLSAIGGVHSFEIDGDTVRGSYGIIPGGVRGWAAQYALVYFSISILLILFHLQEGEISVAPVRRAVHTVRARFRAFTRSLITKNEEKQPLLSKK